MKHSVEVIKLRTGAEGLLVDVPTATVMNMRVAFRAGLRYAKTRDVYEIAHVMEHLSFGANAQFKDEQAYEAEFTKNGAYHNAWTSDYTVCYETECADFEWQRILDLKRVAICSPKFSEDELKSEKSNVRAELTGYMNDYYRLIWPRLQIAIGEDVVDLPERVKTLANIEVKNIREHYRRTHTANNMRFVIAGRVKKRKRQILKNLERWNLEEGERLLIPPDDLKTTEPILIRRKDANNITFGFSFITPRHLGVDDMHEMEILNHILTGTMNSRIFGEARKRGLIYSLQSILTNSVNDASWDFDGEVNVENVVPLFDLIQGEMVKILNGEVTDEEITAAKSYALGRFQMGAQTVGQIADYYAENYFTSGEIENYNIIPEVINSVTKAKVVELARELGGSGIRGFVAVGNCGVELIREVAGKLRL